MPAPAPLREERDRARKDQTARLESDAATFTIYFNSTPLHGLSSFSLFSYGGQRKYVSDTGTFPFDGEQAEEYRNVLLVVEIERLLINGAAPRSGINEVNNEPLATNVFLEG